MTSSRSVLHILIFYSAAFSILDCFLMLTLLTQESLCNCSQHIQVISENKNKCFLLWVTVHNFAPCSSKLITTRTMRPPGQAHTKLDSSSEAAGSFPEGHTYMLNKIKVFLARKSFRKKFKQLYLILLIIIIL